MIQIDLFKELIKDMYRGFPNWRYLSENDERKGVEEIIATEEVRDELVKAGFLIKGEPIVAGGREFKWMLGPNALSLVSAWKSEELSEQSLNQTKEVIKLSKRTKLLSGKVAWLTELLFVISGMAIVLGIIQIIIKFI